MYKIGFFKLSYISRTVNKLYLNGVTMFCLFQNMGRLKTVWENTALVTRNSFLKINVTQSVE